MTKWNVFSEYGFEGQTNAVSEEKAINNVRFNNYGLSRNNDGFYAEEVIDAICKNCLYAKKKSYIHGKIFCEKTLYSPHNINDTCKDFYNDSRRD